MSLPTELILSVLVFFPSLLSAAPTIELRQEAEVKESIWQVNIFKGPAPPPDSPLSPPGAAGALRDPSKRKYEIIGIAGAYVVWVTVTLFLLLTVGLRLRRKAQSSNPTLSMEMIKTAQANEKALPSPGPLSPGKLASLRSWASGNRHKKTQSNATSSSTIDTRLVEEDKQKNMDQMAKLYAHVMAHEQERESTKAVSSTDGSPSSPTYNYHSQVQAMPTPPRSPQHQQSYPPELQHLRQDAPHPSESPYYYPPPQQQVADDISRATTRVNDTPHSFASKHERTNSSNSTKQRPTRISVRGMPISQPIGDADLSQSFGDTEPGTTYARRSTNAGLPTSPRLPPPPPQQHETLRRRQAPPNALNLNNNKENHPLGPTDSNTTLPFRQIYADTGLTSAPYTKTTFVHARTDLLGYHPKTGVPQTPYSPMYMPQTPMTPVTPSMLVGKKEMKRQKKLEGMKVLGEEDLVGSDEDMWGA
ncbi:uncharacterized protein AB675_6935 [Cyphellophora attinorum]|uniref:Uncharacterized protein n=1 Tax=Cyphellophora attinorum TaxID=1664694 RepID=A0A0N1H8C0_9EURO|nr:uncharacterized protein AB675_6935 [Phialophora attinorum]KPI43164.1 hypothetical protein AB675_6935 [Phialophora attinorum]